MKLFCAAVLLSNVDASFVLQSFIDTPRSSLTAVANGNYAGVNCEVSCCPCISCCPCPCGAPSAKDVEEAKEKLEKIEKEEKAEEKKEAAEEK